jgi:hypothetical protein
VFGFRIEAAQRLATFEVIAQRFDQDGGGGSQQPVINVSASDPKKKSLSGPDLLSGANARHHLTSGQSICRSGTFLVSKPSC